MTRNVFVNPDGERVLGMLNGPDIVLQPGQEPWHLGLAEYPAAIIQIERDSSAYIESPACELMVATKLRSEEEAVRELNGWLPAVLRQLADQVEQKAADDAARLAARVDEELATGIQSFG